MSISCVFFRSRWTVQVDGAFSWRCGMGTTRSKRMFLALALLVACGREIGDDCSTSTDCGSGRICDLSQPGGYCTISPCREETCPEESICVRFTVDDSYCMRSCASRDECREGYVCVLDFRDYPGFCNAAPPSQD